MNEQQTRSVGIIFGTWNRYVKNNSSEDNFYMCHDVEEYTDEAIVMMKILFGNDLDEIDSKDYAYKTYPQEWTEGVACLETNCAYYQIDGAFNSIDDFTVDNTTLIYKGEEYTADEWDMQEIEVAINVQTKEQVDLWA